MLRKFSKCAVIIRNINTRRFSTNTTRDPKAELSNIRLPNFKLDVPPEISSTLSLATASQREIVQYKKYLAVKKFCAHESDTGSPAVQIAAMTEKVNNLVRHFADNHKDYASKRGFQMLLSRRRSMMKYLMRTDFATFKKTVFSLGLQKEAVQLVPKKRRP